MKKLKTSLTLATLAILLATVAGCTEQPATDPFSSQGLSPEWKAELEKAAGMATSDFEKEVIQRALTTGKIEDADYLTAINLYTDCMEGKGYEVELLSQPGTIVKQFKFSYSFPEEQYKQDSQTCNTGNGIVSAIYTSMQQNPNLEDPLEKALECIKEKSVVPEDFSKEELSQLLAQENLPSEYSEEEKETIFNCL